MAYNFVDGLKKGSKQHGGSLEGKIQEHWKLFQHAQETKILGKKEENITKLRNSLKLGRAILMAEI